MRRSLQQFVAVMRLAVLEAIRQPICLLVTTTCYLMIALFPILITHTLGEGEKLVRDSSMAFHLVCGLVLGTYAACAALTHEIRRGTVASVLAKPVNRELFFLAKFSGIAFVTLLFSAGAAAMTLMSVRAATEDFHLDWWAMGPALAAPLLAFSVAGAWNFFTRRPFASSAFVLLLVAVAIAFVAVGQLDGTGHLAAAFGNLFAWKHVAASLLVALAIVVLAGIAVSLATRLDAVPTLSICSILLMIGLMSDYLFGRHAADNAVAAALYRILPNWQHFWVTDALNAGAIPWIYVGHVAVYALLYLAGILSLGMLAFRNMEVRA